MGNLNDTFINKIMNNVTFYINDRGISTDILKCTKYQLIDKDYYTMDIYKKIIKETLSKYFKGKFVNYNNDEILEIANYVSMFWAHAAHNYHSYITSYPISHNILTFISTPNERKAFDDTINTEYTSIQFKHFIYSKIIINNMINTSDDIITKFYDGIIDAIRINEGSLLPTNNGGPTN